VSLRSSRRELDLAGDLLVVAYQTSVAGAKTAGFEAFDVADPGRPRPVALFDASRPASRVHHLGFVDGHYVHLAGGAPDFTPATGRPPIASWLIGFGAE
jgi:hypothetical protein